jgi:hypothetical protein
MHGSQPIPQGEADAWANDLRELGAAGHYFFSSIEYIFTADKTRRSWEASTTRLRSAS